MTLKSFKSRLKLFTLICFFVAYGSIAFLLGKSSNLIANIRVKGVSTKAAIAAPVETPLPYADSQSASIHASSVKICANTVYGYQIAYPDNWFTTYNTEDDKCSYFAPFSFVLPQDTSNFTAPIKIEILKPDDYLGEVKFLENPNDYQNIVSVDNLEVDGRSAQRITSTSTGNGQIQKGLKRTAYIVQNSEKPFVAIYQQQDEKENTDELDQVLAGMVRELKLF